MTNHTDLIARLRKGYEYGDSGVVLEAASALEAAQAEIANLHTVMMVAAVEISEHWDAHCDAEGYGPVNLLRHLKNNYPERYGYDSHTVVRMEKERDAAKAEIAAVRKANIDCVNHFDALRIDYEAALARLAITEEANSMLLTLEVAGASPQSAKEHGRTNSGDETGGTVERFGWDISGAKPVVIPATNGAYVWYSDYLKLWKSVQPSQAPTCDLRGIDAGPLSEWVDLVRRGYVAKDECLIAVKDVPKWLAQNQPSQAGELSTEQLLYVQSALKAVKQYGNIFRYERHQVSPYEKIVDALAIVDAAINAKESDRG